MDTGDFTILYSGSTKSALGTGFVVSKEYKGSIMEFKPINERICTLRIRAQLFNITLICVHAPTEETEEEVKDRFYEELENVYDGADCHDVKMILGDMNVKIGREKMYKPVIGQESIHKENNDNGERLIDFAVSRNMIVSSTYFPHKRIHKMTWGSPDGTTFNQIDHVLIDRRHNSEVKDIRSWRGADCNSDHFMVRVKYKQRIANIWKAKGVRQKKYRVEELKKDEGVAKQYCKEIELEIREKGIEENSDGNTVEEKWQNCKEIIVKSADKILTCDIKPKKEWFDEDCKRYIEARNKARLKFLQRPTRASQQEYQEKRMAKKRCRESNRKWEQEKLEEIEDLAQTHEIRQLYKKTGQLKDFNQERQCVKI